MGTRYLLVTDIFGTKHCFWIKNGALFYGPRRTRVTWALVQHSVPNVCIFFCLAGQYASGGKWVPSTYSADLMRELTCPDLACALSRSPKLSLAERTALGCYEVRREISSARSMATSFPSLTGSPHMGCMSTFAALQAARACRIFRQHAPRLGQFHAVHAPQRTYGVLGCAA